MKNNTSVIRDTIYPKIDRVLSTTTGVKSFVKTVGDFINDRNDALFTVLPINRIPYTSQERDTMYKVFQITNTELKNAVDNTYYGDINKFNYRVAQDPLTILMMCVIRYFILKKDQKKLDLAIIYICFSGKYYPSIHFASFRIPPQEFVMEYVIHNEMDKRFYLKKSGSVINSIATRGKRWVTTYQSKFKDFDDDDILYLTVQLKTRIKSFIINIATLYYKAYANKDYIVYNSDNDDPDAGSEYHLANSDSFLAEKCINNTISRITTSGVEYKICKLCSNATVKTDEIKSIMESIINEKSNIPLVRDIISSLVYSYFASYEDKNVTTTRFIVYSITPKPNTSDKNLIKTKETVINWLEAGSAAYRKKQHRLASKNDFIKSIMMYFALSIYNSNR